MRYRLFSSIFIAGSCLAIQASAQDAPLTTLGGFFKDTTDMDVATNICPYPLDQVEGNCVYLVPEVRNHEFKTLVGSASPFYARFLNNGELLKGTYAMPGDKVWLTVADDRTALSGSNTRLLKFLDKLYPYFENSETEVRDTANFKTMDRVAFLNYEVARRNKQRRYVIEYFVGTPPLEQEMKNLLEADINYSYALKLLRYARSGGKEKRFSLRYADYTNALMEVPPNDPLAMTSPAYIQYLYELPFTLWHTEINWGMTDKPPYNKLVASEFVIRDSFARKYFRGEIYELALYGILLDAIKDAAKVKGTSEFDAAYLKADKIINDLGKSFQNGIYYSRIRERLAELKVVPREAPNPVKKKKK